jgi:hypothetical protein
MNHRIPLFGHVDNPEFHDPGSALVLPGGNRRLALLRRHLSGGWDAVASVVSDPRNERIAWFPDANVAILDATTPVWDSLRFVALLSKRPSTVFTSIVAHELEEWIQDPHRNADRAQAIRDALTKKTWATTFALEEESKILTGVLGYFALLAMRRALTAPMWNGQSYVGTDAQEKCETMNAIGKQLGRRAQLLAKKGRIDAEAGRGINAKDEVHCLMAICHALLTGQETMILTADVDFLEIFFKAQWFFDTHYRAWLAAQQVAMGMFGHPVKTLEATRGIFLEPLTLYRRPTYHLREVLPPQFKPAFAGVIYVAPDGRVQMVNFKFEQAMLQMLDARSRTQGRCTDLLGDGNNIHIDLGPLKTLLDDGLYLGVGHDAGNQCNFDGVTTFVSVLDQIHAAHCQERNSGPMVLRPESE